jgi:hypothetical protein
MSDSPVTSTRSSSTPRRTSLRKRLQADRNGVLIAAGVMAGVSWVLLYRLIGPPGSGLEGSPPRALERWLFFILLDLAITGTALPFIGFLNQRFSRNPVPGGVLLRQGMWCGLFMVTIAWLQMTRALTGITAALLALSIIVIETFLRYRERAHSQHSQIELAPKDDRPRRNTAPAAER